MDSYFVLLLLRLLHVLASVFWVGSAIFTAVFLLPTVKAIGPAGGQVMQQIGQVRKFPLYLMAAIILSVLSGLGLFWRASGGFQNAWMGSGPGITFSIGGAFALIAAIIGLAVASPTARRVGALGGAMQTAGRPPTPEQIAEMQRLQSRLTVAVRTAAALLIVATAAMAVARYIA